MGEIVKIFKELKKRRKKAFIVYITFGFPTITLTEKIIFSLQDTAVDIIEIGIPFSDPLADGPILQEAAQIALSRGTNTDIFFAKIKSIKDKIKTPLVVMTYYNPVYCYGVDRFLKKVYESGIKGIMIVDLPIEEAHSFVEKSRFFDLDTVFFITSQTTKERIKKIVRVSKGFIYYISITGITGPHHLSFNFIKKDVHCIKRIKNIPVCVGFGIHKRAQVKKISEISDGFIIGSAFAKFIKDNYTKKDFSKRIKDFINRIYV